MGQVKREYPEWWLKEQEDIYGDVPWIRYIRKYDKQATNAELLEYVEKHEPRFELHVNGYLIDKGKEYDK